MVEDVIVLVVVVVVTDVVVLHPIQTKSRRNIMPLLKRDISDVSLNMVSTLQP